MAAAAVAGSSKTSPFGTLLRRSKFASFDPAIAQVYTTYDGNAHRGNWGLKRPLPLKRRNAYITVSEVDSREQQTVWDSGEKQARWIQAWQELGVEKLEPPEYSYGRERNSLTWQSKIGSAQRYWVVDSEFAVGPDGGKPSKESRLLQQTRAPILPNIDAMSNKQFELFIRNLRKLRPEFKEYLKKKAGEGKPVSTDLLDQAQNGVIYYKEFLTERIKNKLNKETSVSLAQEPHVYAGASYSHHTRLSTFFLTPTLPGRMILMQRDESNVAARTKDNIYYVTSFAGMTTKVRSSNADGKSDVVAGKDGAPTSLEAGVTKLRLREAHLVRAPNTVDSHAKSKMRGARIITEAIAFNRPSMSRSNPHYPGSIAYSTQDPGTADASSLNRIVTPVFRRNRESRSNTMSKYKGGGKGGSNLLQGLRQIVSPTGRPSGSQP
ncbi:hypothetical protein GLOTRDRAFT_109885 [Gloeophyllum trabeum ATCC 11539]|uniref:Uncharacterized protein n=1 Tax=Gloeophyllum trabeum (strain ATCC 11539 / FP-39264 / Madison 617) TaxID=670483 RepID=S7QEN6_GLOTA|nr:uncharacterized protein GLOTRDRAFT_109885 [Gloeophyllum trabeum ATCC 11539]EPQ57758.1 hypothetical protein GLOTRDRAFT_109885 [Gloeophyllum trabeum ATCC 11539]